jgi:hypothetical protein
VQLSWIRFGYDKQPENRRALQLVAALPVVRSSQHFFFVAGNTAKSVNTLQFEASVVIKATSGINYKLAILRYLKIIP